MSPPRYDGVAPFFSLARGEWMPYVFSWDRETREFHGVEGPRGFASYREAVEWRRAGSLCGGLT